MKVADFTLCLRDWRAYLWLHRSLGERCAGPLDLWDAIAIPVLTEAHIQALAASSYRGAPGETVCGCFFGRPDTHRRSSLSAYASEVMSSRGSVVDVVYVNWAAICTTGVSGLNRITCVDTVGSDLAHALPERATASCPRRPPPLVQS
jgi:hypothetical protein